MIVPKDPQSEWQDRQQKPNTKLRDLLKSKKVKTRNLSELSKTEQNRLANLNAMFDELRRGENVQNSRLAIWPTEEEYECFVSDWESQQQIREELKDKPDELRRYENKLHQATFNDNVVCSFTINYQGFSYFRIDYLYEFYWH